MILKFKFVLISVTCKCAGLRYAGTASAEAQQLLHAYALYFMKEVETDLSLTQLHQVRFYSAYKRGASVFFC